MIALSRTERPPNLSPPFSAPFRYGDPQWVACPPTESPCVRIDNGLVIQAGTLSSITPDAVDVGLKVYPDGGWDCGHYTKYELDGENGSRTRSNGDHFFGSYHDGTLRDGRYVGNNMQYWGHFNAKEKFHGHGTLQFWLGSNRMTRTGQFENGSFTNGTQIFEDCEFLNHKAICREEGAFGGTHDQLRLNGAGRRTFSDGSYQNGTFQNGVMMDGSYGVNSRSTPHYGPRPEMHVDDGAQQLMMNHQPVLPFHRDDCASVFMAAKTPFSVDPTHVPHYTDLLQKMATFRAPIIRHFNDQLAQLAPLGASTIRQLLHVPPTQPFTTRMLFKRWNDLDAMLHRLDYPTRLHVLYFFSNLTITNPLDADRFSVFRTWLFKDPSVLTGLRSVRRIEWAPTSLTGTTHTLQMATFFHAAGHYLHDNGLLPNTDFSLHLLRLAQPVFYMYITALDQYTSLHRAFFGQDQPILPPHDLFPFEPHHFNGIAFRIPSSFVSSFITSNQPFALYHLTEDIYFRVPEYLNDTERAFLAEWDHCAKAALTQPIQPSTRPFSPLPLIGLGIGVLLFAGLSKPATL